MLVTVGLQLKADLQDQLVQTVLMVLLVIMV
jgi:hypothetical protein